MRYRESFRRAKISLIWLGTFFISLVIVVVVAQFYAILNPTNQLAIIVANGLSQGIIPVLLLFIGAGIAMITGYFNSLSTMELEIEKERDNLTIGFFYEINALKRKIENIPVDNFLNCMNYVIQHDIKKIYDENGLYYVLKKELFILDKPTLEKLLDFYSNVILVDELLKDTFVRNNYIRPSLLTSDIVEMHQYLNEIKTKSTEIITILNDEIEKVNN